MPPSVLAYTLLVVLVAIERVVELVLSRRNAARARLRGGVEVGAGHFGAMTVLHGGFLLACPLEAWLTGRPFVPGLALCGGIGLLLTMGLRYWCIASLGNRWNTRIILVPGDAPVLTGPYRWVRHPNYLAVVIEGIALPAIHTALFTAVIFGLLNAWMLTVRIRAEEEGLRTHCDYDRTLGKRPRFFPDGR